MPEKIELFYLGKRYYYDSATQIGAMYSAGDKTRYDLCDLEELLERGTEVYIRPPTEEEKEWADERLAEIKGKLKGGT